MTRPNNPDNPKTSLNVYRTTRDSIIGLRLYPKETMDSVINRLINNNNKKSDQNG